MLSTLRGLRRVNYFATFDLQGLVKSAVLARAAGAGKTIGFPRAHLRERLARLWYTDMPEPGEHTHVVFKNLTLLAPLGVRELHPTFPIDVPWTETFEEVQGRFGREGYVLLNPAAAWPNKRWPPARFGAVAAAIAASVGLRSLVLWGPGEETLARAVVEESRGAAELSPPTTITDLFGIARSARLMVSGDTGPLHIAAAVGTPIVALFGPTISERNGPWSAPTSWCHVPIGARVSIGGAAESARRASRTSASRRSLPPCSGGSNMSDDRPAPQLLAPAFVERLARKRVALGFATAAAVLIVSTPTWRTWRFGLAVALAGEAIRMWAAGHLEKSREITRSGPYRWTRHPLYAGSGLIALGIVIASNSIAVTVLASVYMVGTIGAAVRTEEAFLRSGIRRCLRQVPEVGGGTDASSFQPGARRAQPRISSDDGAAGGVRDPCAESCAPDIIASLC